MKWNKCGSEKELLSSPIKALSGHVLLCLGCLHWVHALCKCNLLGGVRKKAWEATRMLVALECPHLLVWTHSGEGREHPYQPLSRIPVFCSEVYYCFYMVGGSESDKPSPNKKKEMLKTSLYVFFYVLFISCSLAGQNYRGGIMT